jgi:hypothetical protein
MDFVFPLLVNMTISISTVFYWIKLSRVDSTVISLHFTVFVASTKMYPSNVVGLNNVRLNMFPVFFRFRRFDAPADASFSSILCLIISFAHRRA